MAEGRFIEWDEWKWVIVANMGQDLADLDGVAREHIRDNKDTAEVHDWAKELIHSMLHVFEIEHIDTEFPETEEHGSYNHDAFEKRTQEARRVWVI